MKSLGLTYNLFPSLAPKSSFQSAPSPSQLETTCLTSYALPNLEIFSVVTLLIKNFA